MDEEVVVAPVESAAPVETSAPVSAPAVETPAAPTSMEDTIRTRLRELNVTEPAPMRAPDGKFVKTPTLAAPVEAPAEETLGDEPAVEPVVEPAAEAPVAPAKPGEVDTTKAPSSWKGAAQAEYDKLPPLIKAEVHRREADFHNGLQAQRQMATIGQMMDAEVRPYEAMIRASNLTPQLVVRDLLNTAYQLRSGTPEAKTQIVLGIAKQYGIDLSNIQSAAETIAANTPVIDPKVAELESKYNTLSQTLEAQRTQAAQAEYAKLQAETVAFAAKPENKHYEAVKLDMAALIESGRANDLEDAYNKAIWANPAVREQLLTQQKEADRKRAAEKAAAAKKAASVNVAPRGTPPAAPVVGTMEDTIRATLKRLQSA